MATEVPASLAEYIENQDRLEREARELFPFEFSTCSYEREYVKQQVFSCLTCTPAEGERRGGVCYSCSISCHGDHELVELFDRRAFRCDCGTPRAGKQPCQIRRERCIANEHNTYSDNFDNIFCECKTTYNHESESGTMYQCLKCEDWFHDRCIEAKEQLPDDSLFEHFLCRSCTKAESWICRYTQLPGFCINIEASDSSEMQASSLTASSPLGTKRVHAEDDMEAYTSVKRRSTTTDSSKDNSKEIVITKEDCCWQALPEVKFDDRSIFLQDGFRDLLCRCDECSTRMASCPAIATEEETYDPPPDLEDDNESSFDAGTRAMESTLKSMPREKAIEGILAFNKLKDHITACLKPLADKGQIVTKEDVHEFFQKH